MTCSERPAYCFFGPFMFSIAGQQQRTVTAPASGRYVSPSIPTHHFSHGPAVSEVERILQMPSRVWPTASKWWQQKSSYLGHLLSSLEKDKMLCLSVHSETSCSCANDEENRACTPIRWPVNHQPSEAAGPLFRMGLSSLRPSKTEGYGR